MAEVDTSFYPKIQSTMPAPPRQLNPLEALSTIADLKTKFNQQQLFEQNFKANQAIGPLMQQSVDPKTGEINYEKFIMLVAANPDTAYRATEIAKEALLRQQTQQDILVKKLDSTIKIMDIRGKLANEQLARGNDGLTDGAFVESLAKARVDGGLSMQEAVKFAANLPKTAEERKALLKSIAIGSQSATDGLKSLYGELRVENAGNRLEVFSASPVTGNMNRLGQVEMGPSVSDMNAPTTVETRQGTTVVPAYQQRTLSGGFGTPVIGPNAMGANAPQEAPQGVTAPTASTPTGPSGAKAAPDGKSIMTKPAPGVMEYDTGVRGNMVKYKEALDNEVGVTVKLLNRIDEMQNAAIEFKMGGGTELGGKLAQMFQALPLPASMAKKQAELVDRLGSGDLSALQEYDKLAGQGAMEQLRASQGNMGQTTNFEFEQFLKRNPNLDTDPRAAEKIFNFIRKISDIKLREQQEYALYAKSGAPIEEFPAYWNQKLKGEGLAKTEPRVGEVKGAQKDSIKPTDDSKAREERLRKLLRGEQ